MPKRKSWSDLRSGLMMLAGVVAVAVAVLVYARVGSLHGKTFPLYIAASEARGVIRGTEVWLDGQRIGVVKEIRFLPPIAGRSEPVLLRLAILESARAAIRRDSRTQVRSGRSMVGAPVIYIGTGTRRGAPLHDGDTLRSQPQTDFEGVSSDLTTAMQRLSLIQSDISQIEAQFYLLSNVIGRPELDRAKDAFGDLRASATELAARLSNSKGSVGLALAARGDLEQRAALAMARTDSIRELLTSGTGNVGRFRRDSTLTRDVASIRRELAQIRSSMQGTDGTFGRFRGDSALQQSIDRAYRSMDALFSDMRKRPLRYVHF